MIVDPTVLILGAGASSDFGFPLGKGLRDLICGMHEGPLRQIVAAGFDGELLAEFIDRLKHSGYTSVDSFLEDFPVYVQVGKAAIACALIPFEQPEKLFPPHAPRDHWYELLLNVLDRPLGTFDENQLSIVTFNYDRSLEYYLFKALTNRHDNPDYAVELFRSLEIVHVHGALGKFAPGHPSGREYTPEINSEALRRAAAEINIIGEATGDTTEFRRARELLSGTKRISFLGFGYHPESVRRLELFNEQWNSERKAKVRVGGTNSGMTHHGWEDTYVNVLGCSFHDNRKRGDNVFGYLYETEPLA